VLKRYASITDPTQIVIVIIVDEGQVKIELTGDEDHPARAVRSRTPPLQFLPLLFYEDGYGLTYGAQLAAPEPLGKDSRVAVPLTWGGNKRADIELQKDLTHAPVNRIRIGSGFLGRENPFFERDDNRVRMWARVERDVTDSFRVGAETGWQHVSFLGQDSTFTHAGGDAVFDTRADPMLPRNAVYGRAAWEYVSLAEGGFNHVNLDGRGYLGLFRQNVFVVRAQWDDADKARPLYLQPLLGGMDNLRGFEAGTAIGDTLLTTSAELRMPLTSPLSIGKLGLQAFVDSGTVYNKGERLTDQPFKTGVGGGVWFSAAIFHLNLVVAHGIGSGTRVHFGGGLSF
jgi:outer membrane protein assembly factor BamA